MPSEAHGGRSSSRLTREAIKHLLDQLLIQIRQESRAEEVQYLRILAADEATLPLVREELMKVIEAIEGSKE